MISLWLHKKLWSTLNRQKLMDLQITPFIQSLQNLKHGSPQEHGLKQLTEILTFSITQLSRKCNYRYLTLILNSCQKNTSPESSKYPSTDHTT